MTEKTDYWKERWKSITPSAFAWEQEALDYLRQHLGAPALRVWTNFEFITSHGAIYEVDALVLTTVGLFLIEIKSWPGTLSGDAHTWTVERPDKSQAQMDNPILLANRKAKALKSILAQQDAVRKARAFRFPYVEALVFLSHPSLQVRLSEWARHNVYTRDVTRRAVLTGPGGVRTVRSETIPGIIAALTSPSLAPGAIPPCPFSLQEERIIVTAVEQAGIRAPNRARKISDYQLDHLLDEGPGYQDWLARHVSLDTVKRRVRQYVLARASTKEQRDQVIRAARREFQLVESLHHPGILRAHTYSDHEFGPALIFDYDEGAVRLDHYIASMSTRLDPVTRISLVRQVADALRYAHSRKILHRGLSPQNILVHAPDSVSPELKIMNWQTGRDEGGSTGTVHVQDLVESSACVYLSPEALTPLQPTGEHSDVFSLGALTWLVFSGQPPAASRLDLEEVLREHGGLRLSAVQDGVPRSLDDLVFASTTPAVDRRLDSVTDFIAHLDAIEKELLTADAPAHVTPADAQPGDTLEGGFVVTRHLGRGSVARAILAEREGEEVVLKIAHGTSENETILKEADVLRQLSNRHVVELVDTVSISGSQTLVLRRAGTETLADRLKIEGHLNLELLERFGTDLLGCVVLLEARGIPHRDLKPANLGIQKMGKSEELHLVLFDFSLSRAPLENIRAGTPQYIDPFLSMRRPQRWDLQAERYSAAITLYEMTTGVLPRWGDGQSDPALVDVPLHLDAERFDPAVRDTLTPFFSRALHREVGMRFDNAEQMRDAWIAAFARAEVKAPAGTAPSAELARAVAAADLDTPLSSLPLGAHAAQALDRLGVLTVQRLLEVPMSEVWAMRGVGNHTRRRIAIEVVAPLAARFPEVRARARVPEALPPSEASSASEPDTTPPTVDLLQEALLDAHGRGRKADLRTLRAALLGLDADGHPSGSAWLDVPRLEELLGQPATTIRDGIGLIRRDWKADRRVTALRLTITDLLEAHGGVMAADDLAQAVLLTRGSLQSDPVLRTGAARAATRGALEAEQAASSPRFHMRRALSTSAPRAGAGEQPPIGAGHPTHPPGADGPLLVGLSHELIAYAETLAWAADRFAVAEPLVPPHRVLHELREISAPPKAAGLPTHRLLRLAASASRIAAVSSRQELYPRGMDARRALILAHGSLLGEMELTVDEIRNRVAARYPEAQPLPDVPELTEMLRDADWDFSWQEERRIFARQPAGLVLSGTSSGLRRRSTTGGTRAPLSPEISAARDLDDRLTRAAREGAFLALMVRPPWMRQAERELCQRFDVERVSLDELFVTEMQRMAAEKGIRWEVVVGADTTPGGRGWDNLLKLADLALRRVEDAIAARRGRTVLLVHAGLLARYHRMDVLERLRDSTLHPSDAPNAADGRLHGLWVLLACDDREELPMLDGQEVPLLTPGQRARLGQAWLGNWHRAGP